eukprot:scaffold22834_cov119-Isochrysis_galbana.AAC.7
MMHRLRPRRVAGGASDAGHLPTPETRAASPGTSSGRAKKARNLTGAEHPRSRNGQNEELSGTVGPPQKERG